MARQILRHRWRPYVDYPPCTNCSACLRGVVRIVVLDLVLDDALLRMLLLHSLIGRLSRGEVSHRHVRDGSLPLRVSWPSL